MLRYYDVWLDPVPKKYHGLTVDGWIPLLGEDGDELAQFLDWLLPGSDWIIDLEASVLEEEGL